MPICECCGEKVPYFGRVALANGKVCKECFHMANYGGYGTDWGPDIQLEWVVSKVQKRKAEIDEFAPTSTSDFGLSIDDEKLLFLYDGWTHSYLSIHSFYAFLDGVHHETFIRSRIQSAHLRKPVKKAEGTCIFLQLKGYTYPSYIEIRLSDERQFFECLGYLKHMCELASADEEDFRRRLVQDQDELELNALKRAYEKKLAEYEKKHGPYNEGEK